MVPLNTFQRTIPEILKVSQLHCFSQFCQHPTFLSSVTVSSHHLIPASAPVSHFLSLAMKSSFLGAERQQSNPGKNSHLYPSSRSSLTLQRLCIQWNRGKSKKKYVKKKLFRNKLRQAIYTTNLLNSFFLYIYFSKVCTGP